MTRPSAICVAELFAGVRGADGRTVLETLLQAFEIVPVDADIAAASGLHRGRPGPSQRDMARFRTPV